MASFFNFNFGTFGSDTLTGTIGRDIVFSFGGADTINTGDGGDLIFSGSGSDLVDAGSGNDKVFAGSGDDTVFGGEGDDYINGGRGFDTASYEGSVSDYSVTSLGSTRYEVASIGAVSDVGTDDLRSVEALYFAADDYTLFIDGSNNAVLAGDDAITVPEDGASVIDVATLLANDQEFDGDTISVTEVSATSASGASVSLVGGQITYDPGAIFNDLNAGETATDSFTYTVDDGKGGTDTATVTVTIEGADDIPPLDARINELHYDNTGSDVGEFIEVRVEAGGDVSDLSVVLYNGSNGASYGSALALGGTTPASSDGAYDYYVFDLPSNGLQNGSPDGLALINGDAVIEFLSYEGALTAVDGPAAGMTSTDIGVSEPGTTPVGDSLQRNEDGTWRSPEEETKGFDNDALPPSTARINELHYDNVSGDVGEFIEIRVEAGEDVSGLSVVLYNGSNGATYGSALELAGESPASSDGAYDYYVFDLPTNGLQNGSPDGLALVDGAEVLEFLSYEGELTATDGPAIGLTSTDIGVSEPGTTPIGESLQRNADGTWRGPEEETKGETNDAGGPTSARINELHYDNDGTDVGEFIELRVDTGEDVSALTVVLYNGGNGAPYGTTQVLSGLSPSSTDGTYDYYVLDLPSNGLQNGSPDGLALVNGDQVVEFLSYEGEMTATAGPAVGLTSTDIGVAETGTTPIGESLQRNDDGTWRGPEAETKGDANDVPVVVEAALIHEIQGSGAASAKVGDAVKVSAVITHVVSNGYYIQEEDAEADADAATSEGIFVFSDSLFEAGSLIEVIGTVQEGFGQTEITSVTSEVILATEVDLPTASEIFLSPDAAQDFEAVEGMRVVVSSGTPDPLTVIENFNLDRFGEITISAGTQTQPTQLFDAQTQATEIAMLQEDNLNNRLLLDDGAGGSNPDEFTYLPGGAGDNGNGFLDNGDDFGNDGTTLRLGAELSEDVEGILGFGFGDYRLIVTETLAVDETTNTGAREEAPADVGGSIQVASANLLNFFSTIDVSGAGSGPGNLDPRGADNEVELERQTDKLVDMLTGTGAEVFAVQEIENNGFGADSAMQAMVDALNIRADADGTGADFAFVDPTDDAGFVGTDAIMAGIIYDASKVTLVHSEFLVFAEPSGATTFDLAEPLNAVSSSDVGDFDRNRPTVIATFEDVETGQEFTVASSHFKSKGDSNLQDVVDAAQAHVDGGGTTVTQAQIDALISDPNFDQGDGQGFWNQVRADAAAELADFIANDYRDGGTETYVLLGDLNAYAKEDPVQELTEDAGLTDIIDATIGQENAYSFVFDGQQGSLDHALADAAFSALVTGATEWHINADEPDLINYDNSFKDDGFFNDDIYAASDHDPLIIGLDLDGLAIA